MRQIDVIFFYKTELVLTIYQIIWVFFFLVFLGHLFRTQDDCLD